MKDNKDTMSEVKGVHQDRLKLNLLRTDSEISRRELLKRLSPFGKVELDSSQCTGCGLCAVDCPTRALSVLLSEETDIFQLLFKHSACVACSCCVEICPEKCLRMERALELDKMDSQSVLFEDVIIRCSSCGGPVGPKTMVGKLRARVAAAGRPIDAQLELCPTCKVKAQFGGLRI